MNKPRNQTQRRGGGQRRPQQTDPPDMPPEDLELIPVDEDGDGQLLDYGKAGATAAAQVEIQASLTVALRFPRNEDNALGAMMKAAQRPKFQEKCAYSFPRGKKEVDGKWVENLISGPSVYMAREFGRVWRNLRWGMDIVHETQDRCHVRGWAWDMQTNTKVSADASFRLLIFRKGKGWIKPDERDKRELINREGAKCVRNCILELIPNDFVDDVLQQAAKNRDEGIRNDLEAHRKKIVGAFGTLNVSADQLEEFLGHPILEVTAAEVGRLKEIYASIRDGNSHWSEYVERAEDGKAKPTGSEQGANLDDLAAGKKPEGPKATAGSAAVPEKHQAGEVERERIDTIRARAHVWSQQNPAGDMAELAKILKVPATDEPGFQALFSGFRAGRAALVQPKEGGDYAKQFTREQAGRGPTESELAQGRAATREPIDDPMRNETTQQDAQAAQGEAAAQDTAQQADQAGASQDAQQDAQAERIPGVDPNPIMAGYQGRLGQAESPRDIGPIVADAGNDDRLTDQQFELVQAWAEERAQTLRAARSPGSESTA